MFTLKNFLAFLLVSAIPFLSNAQNLDSLMNAETKVKAPSSIKTTQTFRSTRVANGHSIETLPKGILDIKIQHRFGYLSDGWSQFFGLDNATIRIGGDYGVTDRLMIGFGRASFEKQWDLFGKYKILEQQSGKRNIPISLAVLASGMIQTVPTPGGLGYKPHFSDRLYYAGQVIIARKFSNAFSLQLMPTIVHYNIVPQVTDPNDIVSIGGATSIRITRSSSLILEYYYNLPGLRFANTTNVLAVGWDIETGGHVFQIMITNGSGIAERPFITESTGKFFNGDIRLGFNISRNFQLGKRKSKGW
jgi:hypothetical protein